MDHIFIILAILCRETPAVGRGIGGRVREVFETAWEWWAIAKGALGAMSESGGGANGGQQAAR
jgi:hypothetical protein